MQRTKAQTGQVVEVVPGARAKVIFVSERYRNVIGLLRQRGADQNPNDVAYANGQCVGKLWPVVAHEGVTPFEAELTLRIVAGQVFVGDNVIRPAADTDYQQIRQMDVLGTGLVERWARG